MKLFHWFETVVANAMVGLHSILSHVFVPTSGWAWGLSIVFLVVAIRILLFPLFVKQIKTQRAMSELAPQIKELQQKYRGDRETLNTELMKLYREKGANPLGGCLPLLVQMPVFLALFRVLNSFKPNSDGTYDSHYGIPTHLVRSCAEAKIFGAPIASSFRSSAETLANLHATPWVVKTVTVVMILLMTATTFITQRQLMARNAASASGPMAQQQKILLYVLPLTFAIFGINFPVGVLLYWMTTNFWTMGQQFLVINKMHAAADAKAAAEKDAKAAEKTAKSKASTAASAGGAVALAGDVDDGNGADGAATAKPNSQRPQNRSKSKKKRNRRGGRR